MNSFIGNQPATSFESPKKQVSTSNSGTTITLDYPVTSVADIRLTINAVLQSYDNYSVSGSTLTVGGTLNNDRVEILFVGRTYGSIAPSDASIVTNSLVDDAVTSSKLSSTAVDNTNTNSTLVTGQTAITSLADTDKFLVSDASDSGNLKYVEKQYLPSGGLVHITSQAFPAANNFTIDSVFSADYENYIMIISMLNCATDDSCDFVFVKSGTPDTGSNYGFTSRGYDYTGGSHSTYSNGNTTYGNLTYDMDADSEAGASGVYNIISPYAAYQRKHIFGTQANQKSTAANVTAWYTANSYHNSTTQQFTGIKFQSRIGHNFRAGSVSGGYSSVSIYGVKNS